MTDPREQLARRLAKEGKSDAEILDALKRLGDESDIRRRASYSGQQVLQRIPLLGPLMDEAEGAARGVGAYLADKVRGRQTSLGQRVREEMRGADKTVRETNSPLSLAGDIVAGGQLVSRAPQSVQALLGNVRSAGRSNKVVDFLEKAAKRVGAGAGAGAVMGAGAAREGERGEGATMGGLMGGALGAVPSVVEGGAIAKDRIGSWWRGRAPENVAAKALEKTVRVDQLDDVLAGRTPTRAETVADVAATSPSNYTDALGREAISQPTEAGGAIKRQMAERAAGRGQRVEQALTRGTGLIPEQPEVTKRMVTEVTRPNVTSAYQAAVDPDLPVDSPVLREIFEYGTPPEFRDPAIQQALSYARNKMGEARIPMTAEITPERLRFVDNDVADEVMEEYLGRRVGEQVANEDIPRELAEVRARGRGTSPEAVRGLLQQRHPGVTEAFRRVLLRRQRAGALPPLQEEALQTATYSAPFLDYAKRGLDGQITSAIKKGDLSTARDLSITRSRLVGEADRLIPGYSEARAVDEGRRALINAMELGRKLGRGTVDVRDAEDMLKRLTPDSDDYADPESIRNMFRRGIADGIRRRMGRKATGEGAIGAVIGNRNAEEVTRLAFPDDASFQGFEQQLMDEVRQLPGEAMTRGAKVDASMFNDNALGAATPWSLAQALKGNPSLLTAQMAGDITRQSGHQMNERAAGVIADVMRSRPGAPNVQDILSRIAQQRAEPARRAGVAAAAGQKATTTNIALQRLLQAYLGRGSE